MKIKMNSWQLIIYVYIIVRTVYNSYSSGRCHIQWKELINQINVKEVKFTDSVAAWAAQMDVMS